MGRAWLAVAHGIIEAFLHLEVRMDLAAYRTGAKRSPRLAAVEVSPQTVAAVQKDMSTVSGGLSRLTIRLLSTTTRCARTSQPTSRLPSPYFGQFSCCCYACDSFLRVHVDQT
jgi:hypothetical protein